MTYSLRPGAKGRKGRLSNPKGSTDGDAVAGSSKLSEGEPLNIFGREVVPNAYYARRPDRPNKHGDGRRGQGRKR